MVWEVKEATFGGTHNILKTLPIARCMVAMEIVQHIGVFHMMHARMGVRYSA
jgi:hypothetical protein